MNRNANRQLGFTLIELMIVVAMIGTLASLAIPTYDKYVQKSQRTEASQNLGMMFKNSASYYLLEKVDRDGVQGTHCIIDSSVGDFGEGEDFDREAAQDAYSMPGTPWSNEKKIANFGANPAFRAFGFPDQAAVYYHYSFTPRQEDDTRCGIDSGMAYVHYAALPISGSDEIELNYSFVFIDEGALTRSSGVQVFRGTMDEIWQIFGPAEE